MKPSFLRPLLCLVTTGLLLISQTSWSAEFPTRPITLVVPYGAGGTTDISARQLAKLAEPLLGHHIDIALVPAYRNLVEDGRLRLLAVLDDSPDPDFPTVPTLTQAGYDIEFPSIVALMAPHGTPDARLDTLRDAFSQAAASDEFADVMTRLNQPVRLMRGAELQAVIEKNLAAYRELANELKRCPPTPPPIPSGPRCVVTAFRP